MTQKKIKKYKKPSQNFKKSSLIYVGCFLLIVSCHKRSDVILLTLQDGFGLKDSTEVMKRDTLHGLTFVQIIKDHALGNFDLGYAIMVNRNSIPGTYEIEKSKSEEVRITDSYLAIVKDNSNPNWGWFYIHDRIKQKSLPKINQIIDSLVKIYPDNIFIKETTGTINLYKNGDIIRSINYGNVITHDKLRNFDKLPYGLYKLDIKDRSVRMISNDGNQLINQQEGVFFVPLPGYDVVKKVSITRLSNVIDSLGRTGKLPQKIELK